MTSAMIIGRDTRDEEIARLERENELLRNDVSALSEAVERQERQSVFPAWLAGLNMQQQSVLVLALRGPDGIRKHHPMKEIVRAYRACVLKAAYYGRPLYLGPSRIGEYVGEEADGFMTLHVFAHARYWNDAVSGFFAHIDELPHHYLFHLAHGAQILGYKHPVAFVRERWLSFYLRFCDDAHMQPETEAAMDLRLGDWSKAHWDDAVLEESEDLKGCVWQTVRLNSGEEVTRPAPLDHENYQDRGAI